MNLTNKKKRKGIIMAGGNGSRLNPITQAISKQLMPIYDKPMIYYPLSSLMMTGIKNILIITTPFFKNSFMRLLGDGSQWGIKIQYKSQKDPNGLAEAFVLGEDFIDNSPTALILGDNIFHGSNLINTYKKADKKESGATIFAFKVNNPENYGIVNISKSGLPLSIEEKPKKPQSNYAITGLYFYDNTAVEKAKSITPSKRGELEITDLNKLYLKEGNIECELFGRGATWFDTGSIDSLNESSNYIKIIENRQGLKIGCPEEIAWRNNWINSSQLKALAKPLLNSGYGSYLLKLIED